MNTKPYQVFGPIYRPVVTKLREFGKKHRTAMFIFKILRRWPNPEFRDYVADYIVKSPTIYPGNCNNMPRKVRNLQVYELGNKNPVKVIMLMNNRAGHGGFCGLWIYYLNRLAFSDKMGFYHVFNCVQSEFYQEDHPMHGTHNVFEYYFQQPCGISLKSAWKSKSVIFDWNSADYGYYDVFRVGGTIDYTFKEADIELFAKLQKKYIKLRPSLERKICGQIKRMFGESKVLAVHARGTDYKVEYKGHPLPITTQDYIEAARIQAEQIGADKIFLATDDLSILKAFQQEFGSALLYYDDVIRSEGTVWNCYVKTNVRNSHYRLGYEIIRDVYTMAACDGFVCGMSYVSFMVQVVKKSQDKEFDTFIRLFHGLRKEGLDLTDANVRAKVRKRWAIEMEIERKREKAIASGLDPDKVAPLPHWDEENT